MQLLEYECYSYAYDEKAAVPEPAAAGRRELSVARSGAGLYGPPRRCLRLRYAGR